MAPERSIGIVADPRYLDHEGPPGHPERPDRLRAVGDVLATRAARHVSVAARTADDAELLRVHTPELLARIEAARAHAPTNLDPDTYLGPASLDVARLAAGASIDLVRRVCAGDLATGLGAIRPPGHHAEADRAMGFCLFNSAAVAARAIQAETGLERILLLDWDVHHGNGTQHIFETDPSVLYVSTHQFPYYPGTGDFGEIGIGRGEAATLNVPLPAGCGDAEYVGVMQHVVVPAAQRFRPELILVSCGFDAHREDPLAAMQVSGAGFAALAAIVRQLADELCGGRLVLLLEGGYALSGLREGTEAVLQQLESPAVELPKTVPVVRDSVLEAVVGRVAQAHGEDFSALRRL